jgi:hypothetical protein
MSLLADGVKEILDMLGLEIPWRRLTAACLLVLAVIGYCDRTALTAGVLDWAHVEACHYDRLITSAFIAPDLPRMLVTPTSSGCIVKVVKRVPNQPSNAEQP